MAGTSPLAMVFVILLTILLPPLGAFIVAGPSVDLIINIALTCLGYFPGHIHAFYLEYIYYHKRDEAGMSEGPAAGVFSDRVQRGQGYGTV